MTVLGWADQHVTAGTPVTLSVKLTSPSRIVQSILSLNDVPVIMIGGDDLRQTLTFTFWVGPGTHHVNVSALDARGCSDRTGLPRFVTVV